MMRPRFSPKARRLLEEIRSAEDHAAGVALSNQFDYDALDAAEAELLKERVADLLAGLAQ